VTSRTRILLLREAVALEQAGARWSQKHAAVVAGYSPSFLRNSDCPKFLEDGEGPKGKPRVFYLPAEVRAWLADRNARARRVA
jgi:hypothetical protein